MGCMTVEQITHRELRNNSARVLARVRSGESFLVTNHGSVVARLSPAVDDRLKELIEAGQVTMPTRSRRDLPRAVLMSGVTTEELLRDERGE